MDLLTFQDSLQTAINKVKLGANKNEIKTFFEKNKICLTNKMIDDFVKSVDKFAQIKNEFVL